MNSKSTTKYFFVLNISSSGLHSGFSDQGNSSQLV